MTVPVFRLLLIQFVILTILQTVMSNPNQELNKSSEVFAKELYKSTLAKNKGNIIISPFSVQTCLTLAYLGASGKTEAEMQSTLKFGTATKKNVAELFGDHLVSIKNNPSLKIANKIYLQEGFSTKREFNELAIKKFQTEAQNLNFADNVNSAKTINTWVEEKTNNKIKDLISSDSLNDDTRLVLVNAIYFKGFWTHQFKPERTAKAPFWISQTQSVDVDMMHIKEKFKYGVFDEFKASAIELPYKDSDVSMLIILPNEREGLSEIEQKMNEIDFADMSSKMYSQEVTVSLPKFKIEFDIVLNDNLKDMGMPTMFSDSAEFGELIDVPVKVSEVVHKAFIEVNEEGAEAAAATGMMIMAMSYVMPTFMNCEHPFIFAIMENNTKPLFIGRHLSN